jgi:hypothetical protein
LDLSTDADQKLWDELAAGHDTDAAQTAVVPPAAEPEEPPEPAQTTPASTAQEPATDPTAAPAAAEVKPDPMAELAEKIGKLEGQLRNVSGHIGGLNQGQQQLREMLTAGKAAADAVKDAPSAQQVAEAMKNPDEFEALRDDFPEWARATELLLDARLKNLTAQQPDPAAIDKIVAERVAKETAAVRTEAIDAHLDGIVDGDWRAERNSPEFLKWEAAQGDEVKALIDSPRLTDAAKLMRLFVKSKQANPAQQILQQRSAKLDAAASVPRGQKAPRSKSPEDMTPAELWEYEAARTDKRLRG